MSKTTYDSFDVLVLSVHALNSVDVIAEVEALESPLLTQQDDQDASSPMQPFAEHLPWKKIELFF